MKKALTKLRMQILRFHPILARDPNESFEPPFRLVLLLRAVSVIQIIRRQEKLIVKKMQAFILKPFSPKLTRL